MWTEQSALDYLYHLLTVEQTEFTIGILRDSSGRRCALGQLLSEGALDRLTETQGLTGTISMIRATDAGADQELYGLSNSYLADLMMANDRLMAAGCTPTTRKHVASRLRELAAGYELEDPARLIEVQVDVHQTVNS